MSDVRLVKALRMSCVRKRSVHSPSTSITCLEGLGLNLDLQAGRSDILASIPRRKSQ